MVLELYDRPVISEPVIETVVPTFHNAYIWAISDLVEVLTMENREEKREKNVKRRKLRRRQRLITYMMSWIGRHRSVKWLLELVI